MRKLALVTITLGLAISGAISVPAYASYDGNNGSVDCLTFGAMPGMGWVTISNKVVISQSNCHGRVVIPDGVTSIGDSAFRGAQPIISVAIPSTVTSIGDDAFSGAMMLRGMTIPSSVTSIGDNAFSGTTSLTSITIPSSVTSIGSFAFDGATALTSVTIPSSVTSIEYGTFSGASSLKSITIPSSVISIGADAFAFTTALTSITIPSTVTSIGPYAFFNATALTSITIPSGVKDIEYHAFQGATSLRSITIPSGVTSIGDYAFEGATSLTRITIPSSVTSIGEHAFANATGLTQFNIPAGVTSIGDWAFQGATSLNSITIPSSVTSIGDWAFQGATSLNSITIPSSVTNIGDSTFANSTSLSTVKFLGNAPILGVNSFLGIGNDAKAYVKAGATGFGSLATWNGLRVAIAEIFTINYNYDFATGGNSVHSSSFATDGAAISLPSPTRTGYSFAGWYADAGFVGAALETTYSPTLSLTVYAKWIKNAESTVKPKITGTAKISKTLTVNKGVWVGNPAITYSYQWYSCTAKVIIETQIPPEKCTLIRGATRTSFAATSSYKNKFLTVKVTGQSAGTNVKTAWLSKSTIKVV